MRKNVTEQLRGFASVPGKQKTWISGLNDDQLYQIFLKLRSGENAASIARYAQDTWKVSPDSSSHSVSQGILKFKQRIGHLLLVVPPPGPDGMSTLDSPLGWEEGSALERMENIAKHYETRIKQMIAEEKETGVKYPFINRDVQALAGLRKAILKQRDWDSSHIDPQKEKGYQEINKRIERRFNNLMGIFDEHRPDQFIRAADRFLQMCEEKCLTMEEKDDGTYVVIEPEKTP